MNYRGAAATKKFPGNGKFSSPWYNGWEEKEVIVNRGVIAKKKNI